MIITVSVLFTLLVVIPAAAIAIIKWAVLPPEKLTPIVLKYSRPLVNGQINCERVELTFWGTFPKVGLRLNDGEIISYAAKDSAALAGGEAELSDTLLKFSRALVTVDIMDYFRRNRITVERLFIDRPFFYGMVAEDGTANWDVLKESEEQVAEEDTTEFRMPVIDLKKIRIRDGHFIYEDRQADLYGETAGFSLAMDNQLRRRNLKTEIKTGFSSLIFDSPAYTLENDLALQFESSIDLHRGRVAFSDAKMTVNDLEFTTDGSVGFEENHLLLDITFGTRIDDISKLLGFVPDEYFQNKRKITTKGSLSLEGSVQGAMGDSISPDVNLHCMLERASLLSRSTKKGIERLDADLQLYLCGERPSASYVSFAKLDMVGTNTSFTAKGNVTRLLTDPYIDAALKGKIDLEAIAEDILNPDSVTVKGVVEGDIEAAFRLDELMDGDLSRLNAAGRFEIARLLLANRAEGNSIYMGGVRFEADTTRYQSAFLTEDDLISARLNVDTINLRLGRDVNTRIGRLDLQARTSRSFDTTAVMPVTTNLTIGSVRMRLPDSVWVAGKNVRVLGGIKASNSDRKKGMFAGQIMLDTLRYYDVPGRSRLTMDNSSFTVEMMPLRDAMRRKAQVAGISTGRGQAADSTVRQRREPGALRNRDGAEPSGRGRATEPQVRRQEHGGQQGGLLRNWEVSGSVKFDALRMFTGMFPLPVLMENTTLRFDTDKINMTDARLKLGRSDFLLTGQVEGMRQVALRGGVLKGNLALSSGYIDCNQLLRAISHSTLAGEAESAIAATEEEYVESWENEELTADVELEEDYGLFMVPRNLDLVLRANARKVDYKDLNLQNIRGEIVLRNQTVNLRKLHMESDIGNGDLTMVYSTPRRDRASIGMELDLDGIVVESLIGLFPEMDEMLPMLRSFEGVLDCQISATCDLDSTSNIIIPSLHTACYLSGENMVLMDGETFAEISKKLMFKNKERNLIDYISVDLLIKDNMVEIYPFMVELDRYKLAVGGVHNLDMTFDYHISVLKSPVPFKLGIDITGDLDNFKFKIVKCKYKQLFKVAREEELQETRLNLRSGIRETIRTQLMANAPEIGAGYSAERIRSRRPEQAVTDMDEDVDESAYVEGEYEIDELPEVTQQTGPEPNAGLAQQPDIPAEAEAEAEQ